ncbi:sigma factor [Cellulomonas sp. Leaf334]|uniref:sigma factor n=1 Tax=Cellulomonas sp. Leaf334 TaxID=1736339 RepID=UPI0009EB3116|nr:sigma factor [Cellulomonas sp. Leaf334]
MPIVAGPVVPAEPVDADDIVVLVAPAGRDAEFTAFVRAATPALTRTAWLLCGDVHQADELVQSALVRTYLAWPRARERDPLAYARVVYVEQRETHEIPVQPTIEMAGCVAWESC